MAKAKAAALVPGGPYNFIVLDRVNVLVIVAPYSIAGYVDCFNCDHECWLGVETFKVIADRENHPNTFPVCTNCAQELVQVPRKELNVEQLIDPSICPDCGKKHLPMDSSKIGNRK